MSKLISDYIRCVICGAPCLDEQAGQLNPLCPEHEEEHRQREIFMTEGGGNDESTDPEMRAMEARDVNEDEGDK